MASAVLTVSLQGLESATVSAGFGASFAISDDTLTEWVDL